MEEKSNNVVHNSPGSWSDNASSIDFTVPLSKDGAWQESAHLLIFQENQKWFAVFTLGDDPNNYSIRLTPQTDSEFSRDEVKGMAFTAVAKVFEYLVKDLKERAKLQDNYMTLYNLANDLIKEKKIDEASAIVDTIRQSYPCTAELQCISSTIDRIKLLGK